MSSLGVELNGAASFNDNLVTSSSIQIVNLFFVVFLNTAAIYSGVVFLEPKS
jgi:hypothetical protein